MTACPEWEDRLLDAALGVPSPGLQEHVAGCAACAAALTDLRARNVEMNAALRRLVRGAEPSPAFAARLEASLETRHMRQAGWPAWARLGAVIAAAVLLAVFLGPLMNRRPDNKNLPAGSTREQALTEWRSPTDALLRSSADEFLQSTPRLGEFYFPIQPARRAAGIEGEKRRNP